MDKTAIGEIGEYLARNHLISSGFEVFGFGKGQRTSGGLHLRCEIPTLPDFGIGYSFGSFGFRTKEGPPTLWSDPKFTRGFDLDHHEIKRLAMECKERKECNIRDGDPSNAPCAQTSRIMDRDWLEGITPKYKCNGRRAKGYQVVGECLDRFTRLLLSENRSSPPYGKGFLLINMLISEYIQGVWWRHSKENALPHSGAVIRDIQKRLGSEAAEALKNENRAALKKFPSGHPGRYDFVGLKDGVLVAFEIKVNSSKPSYWQLVRMALLQKFGCSANLINIKIKKDQLELALKGIEPEVDSIEITSNIDFSKVHIPSDEEFLDVVNYAGKIYAGADAQFY